MQWELALEFCFALSTGVFVLVLVLVLLLEPTASITSTSTISLSASTTEPTHRCVGCRSVLGSGDHVFALVAKDLERFVEDGTQFRKDRTATNPTTFVVFDLRLWNAHPVHFPVDVVPAKRQRFRRRPTLLGKPMHET